jgi:hypothetical protein
MGIQSKYSKVEDIPEMTVKELFTEKDGGMVFTGIEGIKTKDDTDKLEEALRKERNDHGQLKEKLKVFDGVDAEQAKKAMEENELLKLQAKDGIMSEDAQAHIKLKIEQGIASANERASEFESQVNDFKTKESAVSHKTFISDLAEKSVSSDLIGVAVDRFISFSEKDPISGDYVSNGLGGYEKGIPLDKIISGELEKTPSFAKQNTASHGGGSDGQNSTGVNPFKKDTFNRTEQHKLATENPALAKTLQAQAQKE